MRKYVLRNYDVIFVIQFLLIKMIVFDERNIRILQI